MFIVISGNPVDGFVFIGPFQNEDQAAEYGDRIDDGDWWIGKIDQPWGFVSSNT